MNTLAPDQTELLRVLVRHGVEFVVVGGVAAQMHGWRSATLDLDIAVSTEESNVDRLNAALVSVEAGEGHYADWLRQAREHELEDGITVVVAAPDDILRSKAAAGREKDLAALPQMRRDFGL